MGVNNNNNNNTRFKRTLSRSQGEESQVRKVTCCQPKARLYSSVFRRDLKVDKLIERSEIMLCGRLFQIVGKLWIKLRSEKTVLVLVLCSVLFPRERSTLDGTYGCISSNR
jgi:hypothetical protein